MRVFIPTRGRPDKQITLKSIPKHWWGSVTLVTSHEERDALKGWIGPRVEVLGDDTTCLSDRREWIQRHARKLKLDKIVMMDDDLVFLKKGPKKDPTAKTPYSMYSISDLDFNTMMGEMSSALDDNAIVSFAERNRCHTYEPDMLDLSYNTRINGVLGYRTDVVAREKLRWNEFRLCADFDMTLSLYRAGYSGAVICRYIWGQRGTSNAKGGCSAYRTKELHEQVILALAEKHKPFVTVVEKTTKGGWYEGETRTDAKIAWKKAWASAIERKTP